MSLEFPVASGKDNCVTMVDACKHVGTGATMKETKVTMKELSTDETDSRQAYSGLVEVTYVHTKTKVELISALVVSRLLFGLELQPIIRVATQQKMHAFQMHVVRRVM